MNEPIEDLIRSIPLKNPSSSCDSRVLAELNVADGINTSPVSTSPVSTSKAHIEASGSAWSNVITVLGTAAALLVGFLLGTWANQGPPPDAVLDESSFENISQQLAGFELSDNVEVIDGQSTTVIVHDHVQIQNDRPVRKLETVTRKKVLVKDDQGKVKKEFEVPIRKVFYSPAETI